MNLELYYSETGIFLLILWVEMSGKDIYWRVDLRDNCSYSYHFLRVESWQKIENSVQGFGKEILENFLANDNGLKLETATHE